VVRGSCTSSPLPLQRLQRREPSPSHCGHEASHLAGPVAPVAGRHISHGAVSTSSWARNRGSQAPAASRNGRFLKTGVWKAKLAQNGLLEPVPSYQGALRRELGQPTRSRDRFQSQFPVVLDLTTSGATERGWIRKRPPPCGRPLARLAGRAGRPPVAGRSAPGRGTTRKTA
jgi:hypothetical protein